MSALNRRIVVALVCSVRTEEPLIWFLSKTQNNRSYLKWQRFWAFVDTTDWNFLHGKHDQRSRILFPEIFSDICDRVIFYQSISIGLKYHIKPYSWINYFVPTQCIWYCPVNHTCFTRYQFYILIIWVFTPDNSEVWGFISWWRADKGDIQFTTLSLLGTISKVQRCQQKEIHDHFSVDKVSSEFLRVYGPFLWSIEIHVCSSNSSQLLHWLKTETLVHIYFSNQHRQE